ncbi:MAG: serine/threonine protein kinase [Acidobacteria bacterium]|nr:serine/threonine protein kinase [Acidobacteriota bacterium]
MSPSERTIDRYVLRGALGQGGMGMVYLAEDPLLKRKVAIKVVKAEGAARAEAMQRFKTEAEISAKLNHPNVVTIHDVGDEPGVGTWMAMEFIEGKSLASLIDEKTLDLEASMRVLIQASRALRAAHRHAIVHRDVKPENILLTTEGHVKLMDFGIARTMAMEHRLTANGEFYGSPPYTAPELLTGQEPTPASDRYAFAATAMELLTGELPHPGDNLMGMLQHILNEPPVIPAGCPAELGAAFSKALARDPDDRHVNLVDFLRDVIEALPLPEATKERLLESLAQGDLSGDIVPIRRLQKRAGAPLQQTAPPPAAFTGPIEIGLSPPSPSDPRQNSGRFEVPGDAAGSFPPASAGGEPSFSRPQGAWGPRRVALVGILAILGIQVLWLLWLLLFG